MHPEALHPRSSLQRLRPKCQKRDTRQTAEPPRWLELAWGQDLMGTQTGLWEFLDLTVGAQELHLACSHHIGPILLEWAEPS